MGEQTTVARRVVVRGQVQGVFFRDGCRRRAEEAGVSGWVRNEPDGTVAATFEGTADAVDALVRWAGTGPRGAVVDQVEVAEAEPTGATGFEVR